MNKFHDDSQDVSTLRANLTASQNLKPKEYVFSICVLELHLLDQRRLQWAEPKLFDSASELGDYLLSIVPASLKSRFVIFSRHEDLLDAKIGSLRARRQRKIQAAVTAKVACTIGYAWKIPPTVITALTGSQATKFETGSRTQLLRYFQPSAAGGDEPDERTITPFVELLATTCPPPRYESDVEIFTSSYHTKPPRQDSVTLFFENQPQPRPNYLCGVLACSTSNVMDELVHQLRQSPPLDYLPSGDGYDAKSLLQLSQSLINSRTDSNLSSINAYLSEIQYLARSDPTYLKLNYIIHLRDHLENILDLTEQASSKLTASSTKNPQGAGENEPPTLSHRLLNTSKRAFEIQQRADKIYAISLDQLDGKNDSRTKLFAALAAFYLPFTLATGVLGMNIKEIIDYKPKWWVLIALGLPLALITVALPLQFDAITRQIRQFAGSRPTAFKRIVLWTAPVLLIAGVVIAIAIPLAAMTKK